MFQSFIKSHIKKGVKIERGTENTFHQKLYSLLGTENLLRDLILSNLNFNIKKDFPDSTVFFTKQDIVSMDFYITNNAEVAKLKYDDYGNDVLIDCELMVYIKSDKELVFATYFIFETIKVPIRIILSKLSDLEPIKTNSRKVIIYE